MFPDIILKWWMIMNTRLDLTGTYEEAMKEIDAASITDEFKEHLREEYHKVYDDACAASSGTVE